MELLLAFHLYVILTVNTTNKSFRYPHPETFKSWRECASKIPTQNEIITILLGMQGLKQEDYKLEIVCKPGDKDV